MNHGEPLEPDPGLVKALSALDEALWTGDSSPDSREKILDAAGSLDLPLIAILNALHAASHTGEPFAESTRNTADQDTIAESIPAAAGSRFGRFQIQECIGKGGSGLMFRARDPHLGRDVALKIPRAETLLSTEARTRFQREAELLAALRHPSVVPVFEAGELDGIPFIVEEFCPGVNLAAWMARRRESQLPAPWRSAARWMLQIADALARVHACGIVHRDLKPPNILLEPLDVVTGSPSDRDACERLLPRITDFGIARFLADERTLTGSQTLLGTTAYMAPEQARGDARLVGPAADVHALGVILYELLAGRRPFSADNEVLLLRRVVEDDPIPVGRLRKDVPRDLSAICMKCLEKSPGRRYPTAAELRDDLQRFLEGRPVVARPVSTVQQIVRWCRRRPVHAGLLAVVSLSTLGAAVGSWLHINRLDEALLREQILHSETVTLKTELEGNVASLQRQLFCIDARTAQHQLEVGHGVEARALLARYANDPSMTSTFTWRFLNRLCHLEERVWNLGSQVYSVEFSPDGRRLIAGVEAGYAVMWDVETGAELFRLTDHTSCVNAVQFTSDGRRLWTASCDGTIRQWDAASGGHIEVFANRGVKIETLAVSADGSRIAAGEYRESSEGGVVAGSGSVALWDVDQHELLGEQQLSGARIEAVDFSEDGERLAVASRGAATVFDVHRGLTRLSHEEFPPHWTAGATFLPQGRTIAWLHEVSNTESWVSIRDVDSTGEKQRIPCANSACALIVDPVGSQVFVGTNQGLIEARDTTSGARCGRVRQSLRGHSGRVTSLAISPDGRHLASAGFDGTVRLWPVHETENSGRLVAEHGVLNGRFAADGATFSACDSEKLIRTYTVPEWTLLHEVNGAAIALPPDPHDVWLVGANPATGCIEQWETCSGTPLKSLRVHREFGAHLHLGVSSADNRIFVAWQTPKTDHANGPSFVDELRFDGPETRRRLTQHSSAILSFAVSDEFVAVAKEQTHPDIELVDLATGNARLLEGDYAWTHALAFSPDGSLLASASEDRNIYLWDPASGKLVSSLTGHDDSPYCLAFTPDGRELASGDRSGTVRIWNLQAFTQTLAWKAHPESVRTVEFSKDGWDLVTGSSFHDVVKSQFADRAPAGELRVWSAREPSPVAKTN